MADSSSQTGGANGVKQSKCWANNHPELIPPKTGGAETAGFVTSSAIHNAQRILTPYSFFDRYVMFDRVCDNKWGAAVVTDYNNHKENLKFDGD